VVAIGVFLRRGENSKCAGVDFPLAGVVADVECDEEKRARGSRFERSGQFDPVRDFRPRLVSEAALPLEYPRQRQIRPLRELHTIRNPRPSKGFPECQLEERILLTFAIETPPESAFVYRWSCRQG
jgi:hypothetical protein